MIHTCGHDAQVPAHMGRGAAREKRLLAYFNRPCRECALTQAETNARRLTDIRAVPLSGAALDAAIVRYRVQRAKFYW